MKAATQQIYVLAFQQYLTYQRRQQSEGCGLTTLHINDISTIKVIVK